MKGILLTENNELAITVVRNSSGLIESGLTIGNTDYQRVKMIIAAQKGEFKEFPTLGFGIESYLKMTVTPATRQKFINNLTTELLSDGIKAKVTVGNSFTDLKVEI
jgi:hypothetical protein